MNKTDFSLDNFDAVLFDLDGTLLDSLEDLADSMNTALEEAGFHGHPAKDYQYFVGDGVEELALRCLPEGNRNKETMIRIIKRMREIYSTSWNVKTRPYPGITELLDGLSERGLRFNVLSNKPDEFTKVMVSHFFSNWKFDIVAGQLDSIPRKPDPAGAIRIAEKLRIPTERFLYLGDTNTDMKTAVSAGMFPLGVLWGFRPEAELVENGAEKVIAHPSEVFSS